MTDQLLTQEWISKLSQFRNIIVGFSGGLDSTVLLYLFSTHPSLRSKIKAVHIHHGLSCHADDWQQHCASICAKFEVDFQTFQVGCAKDANIEEKARNARYQVFYSLVGSEDCLVLAHHRNDQAETLLLQLMRGAGVDGLAAMQEVSTSGRATLFRPFLNKTRKQLEHYALAHNLTWIDDESNANTDFSRNYIRHSVMPCLLDKWPKGLGNLSRTASLCQEARSNLEDLAYIDCPELNEVKPYLSIDSLEHLSQRRIVNVIRLWLRQNSVKMPSREVMQAMVNELIFASLDANPKVCWSDVVIRRFQNKLYLDFSKQKASAEVLDWAHFPDPLAFEDKMLTAEPAREGFLLPKGQSVSIRYRVGGESMVLHGQTKKLKKLFQEWGIAPWLRDGIPLLYVGDTLALVVGYAVSDLFYAKDCVGVVEVCW